MDSFGGRIRDKLRESALSARAFIREKLAKEDKRVLLDPEPKVVMTGVSENIFTVSLRCYVPTEIYWDVIYDVNEKLFDLLVKEKIVLGVKKLSILNDQNKEIELDKVEVKTKTRGRRNA